MQRNSFNILYLVLTIQSKVIDQSLDRGPVLGVLWLLFNPATSIVEAPDRRHYNRARPVAESNCVPFELPPPALELRALCYDPASTSYCELTHIVSGGMGPALLVPISAANCRIE